jgi:hypothetical protein
MPRVSSELFEPEFFGLEDCIFSARPGRDQSCPDIPEVLKPAILNLKNSMRASFPFAPRSLV